MGIAAVILAGLGIVFTLIPSFALTQMIGVAFGISGLMLARRAKRQAIARGQAPRAPTTAAVMGAAAIFLGTVVFASCQVCKFWMSNDRQIERATKEAREEFRRGIKRAVVQPPVNK